MSSYVTIYSHVDFLILLDGTAYRFLDIAVGWVGMAMQEAGTRSESKG